MCGIVGFVGQDKEEAIVEKMLLIQSHRGPDDSGVWVERMAERYVHLGHNRLAIQDLSSNAHQPFVSACGTYVLVFNGEVYNFQAIRRELEALGYSFVSASDTEVVLYACVEWGMGALEKFRGMFAFAFVNKAEEKLYLVRDRAGVKPLYYYDGSQSFMFASELKSFHEHHTFCKALNHEVLPYYFQMGYIPSPYSIYKDAYKLEAGHYLCYDLHKESFEIEQYWSVDACYTQEPLEKSEAEVLNDLEALLEESVLLRMVSDVPVGVFLSGGYDSTLVTALLARHYPSLHTFTIGFHDASYNEAEHAKAIATHLGTHHTEHYMDAKKMLSLVEQLPYYYDEPFGDSSALPMMMLSGLAKKDVSVALSGDGGDETFCGYSKYFFLDHFASLFSKPFQKKMFGLLLQMTSSKMLKRLNQLLPAHMQQRNIEERYLKFKRAFETKTRTEMFINASSLVDAKEVKRLLKRVGEGEGFRHFKIDEQRELLHEMMRIDYRSFMSDDVLCKVDRASMSVSLEAREPLLDHHLIEYMAGVPVGLMYKNAEGKYLMRQILYKHLPKELVDRPKAGFQVPLQRWLQEELKYLVESYVDVGKMDSEIFDLQEVERMKQELYAGNVAQVQKVWFVLMFEMWRQRWFG